MTSDEEQDVLDGLDILDMHIYVKDPQSGAGNCQRCAHPLEYKRHPHTFNASAVKRELCVCGLDRLDYVHYE